MKSPRQTLIALLLLLPLSTWLVSTGGLPLCCWGVMGCPMAATGVTCPMTRQMAPGAHCDMSAATPLSLPAALLPVVPLPPLVTGIPATKVLAFARVPASAPAAPGWGVPVFHPPHA